MVELIYSAFFPTIPPFRAWGHLRVGHDPTPSTSYILAYIVAVSGFYGGYIFVVFF